MKILVVGTGYVGLVTGTCFAETGIEVVCIDIDKQKIERLNKGEVPIYEPGLDVMIERNVKAGRLSFSTSLADNIEGSEAIYIAVGTPPDEDGSADLKYVLGVAREIGQEINDYTVVVTKSTVPIGTSEKVKSAVKEEIEKRGVDIEFDVASNPEFLKEGSAIEDFLRPDRIVIGTESERALKIMKRCYKPFLLNNHPIICMDIPSAELTKYAANSLLATKISFINDIANLCEIVGADIDAVRKGIGSDSRIGNKFLYAGVGYGGSCFPKDVKALMKTGQEKGHELSILKAVDAVNEKQKEVLFSKVKAYFGGNLKGKKLTIWGLSFKPNTDDMREAPALRMIDLLKAEGVQIIAYDPIAIKESKRIIGNAIEYSENQYMAVKDSDGLIVMTEWPEFRTLNYNLLDKLLKNKVIFDGRNIYEPTEVLERGYKYFGIGRK